MRYLALLRGINVGGKGIIKMAALRGVFEDAGFTDVETYIQSGNVVFTSPKKSAAALTSVIEKAIAKGTGRHVRAVVLDAARYGKVLADAPKGFGDEPAKYRYDVAFMMGPTTAKRAAAQFTVKGGVDEVSAGAYAVYSRRLIAKIVQSGLSRISQKPAYKDMTIRNWHTVTKLMEMLRG